MLIWGKIPQIGRNSSEKQLRGLTHFARKKIYCVRLLSLANIIYTFAMFIEDLNFCS
jgi:hypothetical protein